MSFEHAKNIPSAIIYGCAGTEITAAESSFFAANNPLGLILFSRNIDTPEQIRGLIADFRNSIEFPDPLILIDQEGGRVARLGPPLWRKTLAASEFGLIFETDPSLALKAVRLNSEIQALELLDLGINTNCSPVADLAWQNTHEVIGDRAFANDPKIVSALAYEVCEGYLSKGILPIVKHIPGHGRAMADSHIELPEVNTGRSELQKMDFEPFRRLRHMPAAMTAHIVYSAIDKKVPGTLSKTLINEVIRGDIGFDGLLFSDDIGMRALKGGFTERAHGALNAGCDVVLHCSGNLEEMVAAANGVEQMAIPAMKRFYDARSSCRPAFFDAQNLQSMRETLSNMLEKKTVF